MPDLPSIRIAAVDASDQSKKEADYVLRPGQTVDDLLTEIGKRGARLRLTEGEFRIDSDGHLRID